LKKSLRFRKFYAILQIKEGILFYGGIFVKKYFAFLLAALLGLSAAGCGGGSTGKLEKIQKDGKIVVYTDPNFPPFEFLGADGAQGVDVEIAKAIAAELGAAAEFKEAEFDSILMALKGGKGDIAISGFTITDERKASVDFSVPYIESVQYLILPEGSPLATVEDLADKNVGVAKGYTGQLLLEDELSAEKKGVLAGTKTDARQYNSAMEAVMDLKNGRVAAVVMDEYVAKSLFAKNTGLEIKELRYASGELASEEYGVAVPKGNAELVAEINRTIETLKQDHKIEQWVVEFSE
jgi:polar amino acid transport system substrate-binding protein